MRENKILKLFHPVLCLLLLSYGVHAQRISAGGGLMIPTYWGDLNSNRILNDVLNNSNLGINLSANVSIGAWGSFEAGFSAGKFQGNDAKSNVDYQIDRNLNFSSPILEFSGGIQIHPFAIRLPWKGKILTPFLQMNLSTFHFNPKTVFNGEKIALQPLGTEGQGMEGFAPRYKLWAIGGGGGGGIKLELSESTTLVIDSRLMVTNTDYLDDVSRFYVNFYELRAGNGLLAARLSDRTPEIRNLNEPLNRPTGSQRGGAAIDMYFLTRIAVMFPLSFGASTKYHRNNYRIKCPEFK